MIWRPSLKMRKQIKVLFVTHGADLYGSNQSLLDMLDLIINDVEPIVLVPEDGLLQELLNKKKIKNILLCYSCKHGGEGVTQEMQDRQFVDNCEKAIMITKIIRKERIDIVHSNSSVCDIGMMAAAFSGVPHVWHIREYITEGIDSFYWNESFKTVLFSNSARIITISKCLKKHFDDKYSVCTRQLYDALNIGRYSIEKSDNKENASFIIAGNIEDYKGQWDAIKAVKILRDKYGVITRLYLVGGCRSLDYKWIIEKYLHMNKLENQIFILPFMDDVSELRSKCIGAIVSSKIEAFGRATVESFLAGLMVIGTNSGGTKELIGNDEMRGLLYEHGDSNKLAECMMRVIDLPYEVRCKMTTNARRFVEKELLNDRFRQELLNIYNDSICEYVGKTSKCEIVVNETYKRIEYISRNSDSNDLMISALWLMLNKNGGIANRLISYDMYSVAIYGMGKFGKRLYDELTDTEVKVVSIIDRKPGRMVELGIVKNEDEDLGDIDALIVTVSKYEDELVRHFRKKGKYKVVGLSDLLR